MMVGVTVASVGVAVILVGVATEDGAQVGSVMLTIIWWFSCAQRGGSCIMNRTFWKVDHYSPWQRWGYWVELV